MTTGNDGMKPHLEEVPIPASKTDIKRLELKIDQLNDRLDTLLTEGGRGAGAKASAVLNQIMSQARSHPAMTPQAQQLLESLLKPLASGIRKGDDT